ncbi:MAG: hypothetical protein GX330_06775 [Bacteroidales bacterium]|nr:hypothetical protein [Bacteroidales bacterium]
MRNYLLIKVIIGLFLLGFISCDKADIRGMFFSYNYVNERFDQSMEWNDIHGFKQITTTDSVYKIYVMGDSHMGTDKNYNTFIFDAIEDSALAVVMNGDITSGRAKDVAIFEKKIPPQSTIESFLLVGNHDLYFDGWDEFYKRLGSSTYYFTVQTPQAIDLFICLDSGSGTLGYKQMNWLKNILKDRTLYRNCIVFTHCNFFRSRHTSSTNPNIEEIRTLLDLFLTHNINMVITGHDHKRSIEILGNTTYITMDALLDGHKHASYLKLSIGSSIHYDFEQL